MSTTIDLEFRDAAAVVTCAGDLDLQCAGELRRTLASANRSAAATVVIDLSATDLVDSTTLGVLLHASTACRESGSLLVIAGAARSVARSIALTGLDRVLTLAPGVPDALALGSGAAPEA
jgi:anti-anti-sigma factor